MKLSEELKERGFVYQSSPEDLGVILDGGTRTVYLGVDPTAEAMHVGHLVPYMLLNHLMRAGHTVILLIGGGTALIGDPSGKDTEREFVEADTVRARSEKLEQNIRRITVSGDITFLNNFDWLSELHLIDFLRDVGKHFTVNALMKKESVAKRLESERGISFTEFSYALLQSYDYWYLHQHHGCDLQIGASDQWGNITAGIDYIRRVAGNEVYGLTMPLLVNPATGRKFGKSEEGTVWLDADMTTPYQFYQFWFNTSDEQVIAYLKLFTFLSLDEIAEIEAEFSKDTSGRLAQHRLAEEVTRFVHGEDVEIETPILTIKSGMNVVDVLIQSGLAASKREAREFVESGAVTLDGERITDTETPIGAGVLQRGKKKMNQVTIELYS